MNPQITEHILASFIELNQSLLLHCHIQLSAIDSCHDGSVPVLDQDEKYRMGLVVDAVMASLYLGMSN